MIRLDRGISYRLERDSVLIILKHDEELFVVGPHEGRLYYYPITEHSRGLSQEQLDRGLAPVVPKIYRLLFEEMV